MTFGYSCREAIPCFGCDRPMDRCVCEPGECAKCGQNYDDYGYCQCKSDNGLSMEEVEARIARFVNPETSLVEVEEIGPGRIAA
jgi:hypothetical protein